ncbi:hypothetical protein ACFFLJ_07890 [Acetobacter farinalis]
MSMDCAQCGAAFSCTADAACWCMQKPHDIPLPERAVAQCLCPTCLEKLIRETRTLQERSRLLPSAGAG